jgi:hypothetical protein
MSRKGDILVLIMKKKCPDTVTMCLLKADMFAVREEHVTKSMQGEKPCFVQIVTLIYPDSVTKMKLLLDMTIM